jgi:hypothetical protein
LKSFALFIGGGTCVAGLVGSFEARRSHGEPERIVGEQGKCEVNVATGASINLLSTNGFVYSLLTMFVARRSLGRPLGAPRAG